MLARLRCPPDRSPTITSARSARSRSRNVRSTILVDLDRRRTCRQTQPGRVAKHTAERQLPMHDVVLRDVPDPGDPLRGAHGYAVVQDRTFGDRAQPCHRLEQRGLAGTAPADQRDQFSRRDRERDIIEHAAGWPRERSLERRRWPVPANAGDSGSSAETSMREGEFGLHVADRTNGTFHEASPSLLAPLPRRFAVRYAVERLPTGSRCAHSMRSVGASCFTRSAYRRRPASSSSSSHWP